MAEDVRVRTKAWAVSAVVLGILSFAMTAIGLIATVLHIGGSTTPVGTSETLSKILAALGALTAIGFISGGAGILKQKPWGRETLLYSDLMAIVLTLLSSVLQWSIYHDPDTVKLMSDQFNKMPQLQNMSQSQRDQTVALQLKFATGAIVGGAIIQLAYCIPLCLRMAAKTPEATDSDAPRTDA